MIYIEPDLKKKHGLLKAAPFSIHY